MGFGREARERNTKSQTPSSRKIPESKHQTPSSKHQRNPKFQAPNRCPGFELGTWSFLGVWSFNRRPLLRRVAREKTLRCLLSPALTPKSYCCHGQEATE